MATGNNIKNFTVIDIEKYHKGQLSAKERHDLEKAALDDPFLADALEGYAVPGVNAVKDINELKERLADKLEAEKVVSMNPGKKSSFPWLRVAALIILIAGAGMLAKQFIFTGKQNEIARADTKKEEVKAVGTTNDVAISPVAETTKTNSVSITVPVKLNSEFYSLSTKDTVPAGMASKDVAGSGTITTGKETVTLTAINTNGAQPVTTAPVKINDDEAKFNKQEDKIAEKKDIAKEESKTKTLNYSAKSDKDEIKDQTVLQQSEDLKANKTVVANRDVNDYRNNTTNIFRGRVTDASNAGVPFANVTNVQDNNAGTYTDARGYFNLTYPDSVLNVQVRSIGFENTNVQLKNTVANNQVVMQDDRKSLSEVVINNQKPNATARNRDSNTNMKLVEPEPTDGWDNYDAYLANNLNAPEEIKTKPNTGGEVQVSFEVDKNGNPVNIKVEKSLCPKCDNEAKRLIKEGPKWKRNAKKGRTTVTISFNSSF